MRQALPTPASRGARATFAVQIALLLAVACFVVSTVPSFRPAGAGFIPLIDGWVQGSAYVLCAVLAALRPATSPVQRLLWSLVAAALAARALGFVLYLAVVRQLEPVPYPSVADVGWLVSCLLLLIVLAVRVRQRAPRLASVLVLDGLLGALTAAAIAAALLRETLVDLTRDGTPAAAVVTNLAYPIFDVALLVVALGLLVASRWRLTRSDWVLLTGITLFAAGDTFYVYELAAGTFRPGTWLTALTMVATVVMAFAPHTRAQTEIPERAESTPMELLPPTLFTLVCGGLLVLAASERIDTLSVPLAGAGLFVALVRALVTILGERAFAKGALGAKASELRRFRALVETSVDFIGIAAIDGTLSYLNPAGRRMVGLGVDEDLTGTRIPDLLTDEGRRLSSSIEMPAVFSRGHYEGQSTLRDHRGGPPIPVTKSTFVISDPATGEPTALATVQRDITERLQAETALRALLEQRQELLGRLVDAQEDERSRIAADVHDDSVQALAAVELLLGGLLHPLRGVAPELVTALHDAQAAVGAATSRLRHLLFDLETPSASADLDSIIDEAAAFLLEDSGIDWSVDAEDGLDLPPGARITAYRIAKEAIVNARAHSGAQRIGIELRRDRGGVELTVRDDGCGFDVASVPARPGHMGLAVMRDRAAIAGGDLRVTSRRPGGTVVTAWLPHGDVALGEAG